MTAVGKLFKPALVEREIEETVRAEAKRVGAELSSVRVERDPHSGLRAVVAAADRAEALRDALDRYAFKSEVVARRNSDCAVGGLRCRDCESGEWDDENRSERANNEPRLASSSCASRAESGGGFEVREVPRRSPGAMRLRLRSRPPRSIRSTCAAPTATAGACFPSCEPRGFR